MFSKVRETPNRLENVVFTDASLGNLNEGIGSTGAHEFWSKDRKGNCYLIAWQTNKIKLVVKSTIAAEALSLQEGLESAAFYKKLLEGIIGHQLAVEAYIDNKSVIESLNFTKLVDDRRLRIDIVHVAIRETVNNEENTNLKWCAGKNQLANCMTKRGAFGLELLQIVQCGKFIQN